MTTTGTQALEELTEIVSREGWVTGEENSVLLTPQGEVSTAEHLAIYRALRTLLVADARTASQQADSWRNFNVGCAILAHRPDAYHDGKLWNAWRVFLGANMKQQENWHKVCAEEVAAYAARSAGYTMILAAAIFGEPKYDDDSGVAYPTLHPCQNCRRGLSVMQETTGNTLILSASPQSDGSVYFEEFTLSDLCKLHSSGGTTPMPSRQAFRLVTTSIGELLK